MKHQGHIKYYSQNRFHTFPVTVLLAAKPEMQFSRGSDPSKHQGGALSNSNNILSESPPSASKVIFIEKILFFQLSFFNQREFFVPAHLHVAPAADVSCLFYLVVQPRTEVAAVKRSCTYCKFPFLEKDKKSLYSAITAFAPST